MSVDAPDVQVQDTMPPPTDDDNNNNNNKNNNNNNNNTPTQLLPANGDLSVRHRKQGSRDDTLDTPTSGQERSSRRRSRDETLEAGPRDQSRPNGTTRRPSERSRVCGKCGGHLTGQFVRALGDTYHLECFTCHVGASSAGLRLRLLNNTDSDNNRTVVKSSPRNSSLSPINLLTNTHSAKPTISVGWTSFVMLVEGR